MQYSGTCALATAETPQPLRYMTNCLKVAKIQKFPRKFKKDSTPIVAIEVVTTQAKILSSALSLS